MPALKTYTYKNLKGAARDKARDWLESVCTENEWWDNVYEHWIEILRGLGIETDKKQILFSGFSSQGSGASFTGNINIPVFLLAHELVARYLPLYAEAVSGEGRVSVKIGRVGGSHYVHAFTTVVEVDVTIDTEELDEQISDFERTVGDYSRGYMHDLYRDLEKEYEYLCSDENLLELCAANEWRFTKEGEFAG
jgi:hypothetical protein